MPHQVASRQFWWALGAALMMWLAACAEQPIKPPPPPVYPPAPETPRFIYDGSLRSSGDLVQPTFGDKFRNFISGTRDDPEGLAKPYGVAVKDQRVYVTDTQQRAVLLFDVKQRGFKIFGREGKVSLLKPLGIVISPRNELFVVDISAKRIAVFDLDGNYLRSLGDDSLFDRPTGIALSPDGDKLYISDTGGIESDRHRVLVLDSANGKLLQTIGKRGQGEGEFNLPLQIAVDRNGKLYVVDSGNFRVQTFSADGKYLGQFGSVGRRTGQFSRPKGIATDTLGNVYVVDTAFGNFQIFSEKGELLLYVGDRNTADKPGAFMLPAGITVDEEGRVYVIDQFFRKVDVFRPIDVTPLPGIPQF